ncbi:DUF760 domain-containing protein [Allocoleopsis franciscana]|uniref:DUF760 domain-containing protein n=1 Tax=Allocoleopsis franciscana PCC 7113 TaxID=1173027 RepID=K9WEV8_9CYAN|nr:DUF760 domain-containing protein [Allocoleopsis franciscana]AFZ18299.1 Protein of unknown function (DUF760) [Allocoleopsis franciscana PCC 7113]
MSNLPHQLPKFFDSDSMGGDGLWQYIQSLHPEAIAQLSQPSLEAAKVIENNIIGMLGTLPSEAFDVTVTTSREYLGQLLVAAMIGGYFLHNAEQRLTFEQSMQMAENK